MSEQRHKLVMMIVPADFDTRRTLEPLADFDPLPFAEQSVSLNEMRSHLPIFDFEVQAVTAAMRQLIHGIP